MTAGCAAATLLRSASRLCCSSSWTKRSPCTGQHPFLKNSPASVACTYQPSTEAECITLLTCWTWISLFMKSTNTAYRGIDEDIGYVLILCILCLSAVHSCCLRLCIREHIFELTWLTAISWRHLQARIDCRRRMLSIACPSLQNSAPAGLLKTASSMQKHCRAHS